MGGGTDSWLLNLSPKSCCSPNGSGTPPDPAQYQCPDGKVRCEAAIHCGCKELLCPRASSRRRPQPPARPGGSFDAPRVTLLGRGCFLRGSLPGSSPPALRGRCWGPVPPASRQRRPTCGRPVGGVLLPALLENQPWPPPAARPTGKSLPCPRHDSASQGCGSRSRGRGRAGSRGARSPWALEGLLEAAPRCAGVGEGSRAASLPASRLLLPHVRRSGSPAAPFQMRQRRLLRSEVRPLPCQSRPVVQRRSQPGKIPSWPPQAPLASWSM